jgi:hypothetical protein
MDFAAIMARVISKCFAIINNEYAEELGGGSGNLNPISIYLTVPDNLKLNGSGGGRKAKKMNHSLMLHSTKPTTPSCLDLSSMLRLMWTTKSHKRGWLLLNMDRFEYLCQFEDVAFNPALVSALIILKNLVGGDDLPCHEYLLIVINNTFANFTLEGTPGICICTDGLSLLIVGYWKYECLFEVYLLVRVVHVSAQAV